MPENKEPMVTITESEYLELIQDQQFLECLRGCGVDNWCGYDDAVDMFEEMNSE